MKKFTFLFLFIAISVFASAQNQADLARKIQQITEKHELLNQQLAFFSNYSNEQNGLKSVAEVQTLDSTVTQIMIRETETWENDSKDEYLYDAEMRNTSWLSFGWNSDSETWKNDSKTDVEYNAQGQVSTLLMYSSDGENPDLILVSKLEVKYDAEGRADTIVSYQKESETEWLVTSKQVFHYNETGQMVQVNYWVLQGEEGQEELTESMKVEYIYGTSDELTTTNMYYLIEGEEILYSKMEYSYNEAGQPTSLEVSALNLVTLVFGKSNRTVYEYNAEGDVDFEIFSVWSTTTEMYIEQYKDEYTYSDESFSEVVFPSYIDLFFGMSYEPGMSFNKLVTGVNTYQMINGNWEIDEKSTFYYSGGIPTGVDDIKNAVVAVYPNPATESVTFMWKDNYNGLDLEIYQMTGARVLAQKAFSGKLVPVSHLENGVYFYKLKDGSQTLFSGKMIKK
jgi:hypothetical protein